MAVWSRVMIQGVPCTATTWGTGQGAGSGWGDLGWGLRLCISNMPAGSEVHSRTESKADPSQQAGRDVCGSQAEALGESWQTGTGLGHRHCLRPSPEAAMLIVFTL